MQGNITTHNRFYLRLPIYTYLFTIHPFITMFNISQYISQYITISQDSFYNINANQDLEWNDILNYYYSVTIYITVSTLYLYGIYYISCYSNGYYRSIFDIGDGDDDEEEENTNDTNDNTDTKKDIAYQVKWFEEFDEMSDDEQQEGEELTEEFVNNLSLNTITETTPRGDVLMYYSSKLGSFVYHSHTKEIPYSYLETVARKYVIEYNCKKLYIDIRKEYEKGVKKYKEIKAKEEEKSDADDTKEKENKKKQLFANFKTYNRKGEVHNKQKDKIYILKEQANRYSYRGKIEEYSEAKVESCLDKKVLESMGDKRSEEEKRVNDIDFATFKKMKMNTN